MAADDLPRMVPEPRDLPPRHQRSTGDGRSGLVWKLASVIASLAVFAVVVWFVYEESGSGDAVPVIEADSTPYKTKPDNPGGMEVDHQEILAYEVAVGRQVDADESLAPAAEAPAASVPVGQADTHGSVLAPGPDAAPSTETTPAPDGAQVLAKAPGASSATAPAQPSVTSAGPAAESVAGAPLSKPPGAGVDVVSTAAADPVDVPKPVGDNWASGYLVQLGAFGSLQRAKDAWDSIKPKYPDILGGNKASVREVMQSGRKPFYRLRTGPYATRQDAQRVCSLLVSRGQDCIISASN